MATTTTNLALTKSAGSENYSIDIVNANLDKIDAGCVNVSGTQTIDGVKTFTSQNGLNVSIPLASNSFAISSKATTLTKGTNPSTTTWPFSIRVTDSNGINLNYPLSTRFNTDGTGRLEFRSPGINARNVIDFAIENGYVTSEFRAYNSSNTSDVVTIGSLQASTDVVHRSGNETIVGEKSITNINNNRIRLQTDSGSGGWRKVYEWPAGGMAFTVLITGRTGVRRNGTPIFASVNITNPPLIGDGSSWNNISKLAIGGSTTKEVAITYDPNTDKCAFYYNFPQSENTQIEVIGSVNHDTVQTIAITPVLENPTTFTNYMVV